MVEPSQLDLSSNVPRETMIHTAVNFLQNPRVKVSPLSQQKAFLLKKGLTDEEVELALQRASILNSDKGLPQQIQALVPANNTGLPVIYRPSIWAQIFRTSSTVVLIAIALYGLQQFYKLYIEPWLYGYQKKDRLLKFEEQLLEMNRSLAQLQKSVSAMEKNINQKTEQNRITEYDQEHLINPIVFAEMRTDIATIKSLLLNRHQFPDVPKIYSGIPSWQLVGSSDDTAEKPAAKIGSENNEKLESEGSSHAAETREDKGVEEVNESKDAREFNEKDENSSSEIETDANENNWTKLDINTATDLTNEHEVNDTAEKPAAQIGGENNEKLESEGSSHAAETREDKGVEEVNESNGTKEFNEKDENSSSEIETDANENNWTKLDINTTTDLTNEHEVSVNSENKLCVEESEKEQHLETNVTTEAVLTPSDTSSSSDFTTLSS